MIKMKKKEMGDEGTKNDYSQIPSKLWLEGFLMNNHESEQPNWSIDRWPPFTLQYTSFGADGLLLHQRLLECGLQRYHWNDVSGTAAVATTVKVANDQFEARPPPSPPPWPPRVVCAPEQNSMSVCFSESLCSLHSAVSFGALSFAPVRAWVGLRTCSARTRWRTHKMHDVHTNAHIAHLSCTVTRRHIPNVVN